MICSVNINKTDAIMGTDVSLHVETSGHILHAFVNGVHIGNSSFTIKVL